MFTVIAKAGGVAAAGLVLATAAACVPGSDESRSAASARQKIIVEFSLPATGAGTPNVPADADGGAMRNVADAILTRLDARARASAQVYEHLPLLALEADGAILMQLLRMPEVVSVAPDRPVSPIAEPPGFGTIPVPQGGTSR